MRIDPRRWQNDLHDRYLLFERTPSTNRRRSAALTGCAASHSSLSIASSTSGQPRPFSAVILLREFNELLDQLNLLGSGILREFHLQDIPLRILRFNVYILKPFHLFVIRLPDSEEHMNERLLGLEIAVIRGHIVTQQADVISVVVLLDIRLHRLYDSEQRI